MERRDLPGHNPVTKGCPCSGKSPVQCFLSSSKFGSHMDSQYVSTMLLISATLSGVICGSISIGSVCLLWVRRQVFGQAGAALCAAGVVLLGLSIWGSVELAGRQAAKNRDTAALLRMVQDSNATTIAKLTEVNKEFTERIETSQERVLSNIQSHMLAIRTALAERPAVSQQSRSDRETPIAAPVPKRRQTKPK